MFAGYYFTFAVWPEEFISGLFGRCVVLLFPKLFGHHRRPSRLYLNVPNNRGKNNCFSSCINITRFLCSSDCVGVRVLEFVIQNKSEVSSETPLTISGIQKKNSAHYLQTV